ncbi:MAG: Trm112 family protein [Candidatus Aenigmarchaeota archaeon]|nr:Trm112 family protein [Candidatus Aenigmarchaeota archaeon]
MMINKQLLSILACPRCKGRIEEKGMFLLCRKCRLAYTVLGGTVPNMIIEEAWPLGKAEKSGFKHDAKL